MQRNELIGISGVIEGFLQAHHLCVRHVGIAITVRLDDERETRMHVGHRRKPASEVHAVANTAEPLDCEPPSTWTLQQVCDISGPGVRNNGGRLQLWISILLRTLIVKSCAGLQHRGDQREMSPRGLARYHNFAGVEAILFRMGINPPKGAAAVLHGGRRQAVVGHAVVNDDGIHSPGEIGKRG